MTDELLSPQDRKEALSRVYVRAIAAGAGYDAANPAEFDRDSVDLHIRAGGTLRPALDVQLKATTRLGESKQGTFGFPLPLKNYDDLRRETAIPRLLIVLDLPADEREWVTTEPDLLILRRCAYWLCLRGMERTSNLTSVTVRIPASNRFDVAGLRRLMEESRRGRVA